MTEYLALLLVVIIGCFVSMFLWTRFTRWRRRNEPRQLIAHRDTKSNNSDMWGIEKKEPPSYKNGNH